MRRKYSFRDLPVRVLSNALIRIIEFDEKNDCDHFQSSVAFFILWSGAQRLAKLWEEFRLNSQDAFINAIFVHLLKKIYLLVTKEYLIKYSKDAKTLK